MSKAKSIFPATMLFITAACSAAPLTPGDLLVYRVGQAGETIVNSGNSVFVDEYTPAGAFVESIAMPASGTLAPGQNYLIASGTATSEGLLTVSPNGQYVALTGYDAALGSQTKSLSSKFTGPRTVGIINVATGAVDTSTALTDFAVNNNPRSAVTTNGTDIWVGGAAGGVRYTTLGSSTSTQLDTTVGNVEQINDFGGQLYFSEQKAGIYLGTVGTGMSTTTGQTSTALPGFTTTGSPYGFVMFDINSTTPNTLYVADSDAIEKYSLSGGSWNADGSVAANDPTGYTITGLTGYIDSTGNVDLFASAGGDDANTFGTIYNFTDTTGFGGAISGSASNLLSAPAGENFRGIAYVPVPEPATFGLITLSLLRLAQRRRRS